MIAGTLPLSDLLTYQIHIERPRTGAIDPGELAGETQPSNPSTSSVKSEAEAAALAILERPSDKR